MTKPDPLDVLSDTEAAAARYAADRLAATLNDAAGRQVASPAEILALAMEFGEPVEPVEPAEPAEPVYLRLLSVPDDMHSSAETSGDKEDPGEPGEG